MPGRSSDPIRIQEGVALQTSEQIKEYLLCFDCEQRLCRDEDYVKRLAYQKDGSLGVMSLLDPATGIRPKNDPIASHARAFPLHGVDCMSVARFAASVFWRAHVAVRSKIDTLFLWKDQAEALRLFILGQRPLPERMCLFMWAISEGEGLESPHSRSSATPGTAKRGYESFHQFLVAGLMFVLTTGDKHPRNFCLVCGGRPYLQIQDWRRIRFLQKVADAARSAEPKGKGAIAAARSTPEVPGDNS